MMKFRKIIILFALFSLASCISTREIRYIQPNENLVLNEEGLVPYNYPSYRITRNDMLDLSVITTPEGDAAQFYSQLYAKNGGNATGNDANTLYFNGLKLDANGDIEIFGIGKMHAEGKTPEELAAEIQQKVDENFQPLKSEVRVNLAGIKYYILSDLEGKNAEVIERSPNFSILEAIAKNGGLDRKTDRKNVILRRKFPEGIKTVTLDLTREDIQNSPYFWLQNGDMIMLNTKPKSLYGFGSTPLQTIGTLTALITSSLTLYLILTGKR